MKVAFIWHRFWFYDSPFCGVCLVVPDNFDPEKDPVVNGLPDTEKYWCVQINGEYIAYHLTADELVRLEEERSQRENILGPFINHDLRHSISQQMKRGDLTRGESMQDDPMKAHFPEGTSKIINTELKCESEAFRFAKADVINLIPAALSMGAVVWSRAK